MKFYNLSKDGYLVSITETNDDNYIQPENSTTIEPPELIENETCRLDGEQWIVEEIPPPEPTNIEKREQAYRAMLLKENRTPLLEWQGVHVTVDQANLIYLQYSAEGSSKASEIQTLIMSAKEYIRNLYPDEVI